MSKEGSRDSRRSGHKRRRDIGPEDLPAPPPPPPPSMPIPQEPVQYSTTTTTTTSSSSSTSSVQQSLPTPVPPYPTFPTAAAAAMYGGGVGVGWEERNSIYVGNVDYSATQAELQALFQAYIGAPVKRCTIMRNRQSGLPMGYAYMEFFSEEAVAKAVELTDTVFKGRQLKVSRKRKNVPGVTPSRAFGGATGAAAAKRPRGGSGYSMLTAADMSAWLPNAAIMPMPADTAAAYAAMYASVYPQYATTLYSPQ